MRWLLLALVSFVSSEVISIFGSSVANGYACSGNCSGTVSSSDDGGCYQSRWRVFQRARQRTVVNNARNGDTTQALLNRFSEMLSVNPKYVVFGLSLANEGILFSDKQTIFDQYATNMQLLINQSRANNVTPLLLACYPHNSYGPIEYDYITRMNILSQSWGVPQINILGSIDDGTGKWANGFWYDGLHPNDLGSTLMYRAFVPTMLEAIAAGKPTLIPRATSQFASLSRFSLSGFSLTFNVSTEAPIFPWAVGLWVRTEPGFATSGDVLILQTATSDAVLSMRAGKFEWQETALAVATVDDGEWHFVVVSHKWASQHTSIYLDGVLLGQVTEQIAPLSFSLGLSSSGATVDVREWSIYRSSLSQAEVSHLFTAPSVLHASLEVYAPLAPSDLTVNHAPSMAELIAAPAKPSVDISVFGSSVANGYLCTGNCSGTSSTSDEGGCYQSRLRVFQRSLNRTVFNNCRNGDTTSLLLSRFSEMLSVNPKYVLIGLSLANEGLINPTQDAEQVFERYAAGMQQLINQSWANNIIPFIGSCYPNNDYNSTQYEYITRMNILSQSWGVPQINFLGAIEDGAGRWTPGYFANEGHPNDPGSTLMFHAMVPSLLEAIAAGKPARVPRRTDTTGFISPSTLTFTTQPQATIYSWAISISFQVPNGSHFSTTLLTLSQAGKSVASLEMQSGWVQYRSAVRTKPVNDGRWHTVLLSHNWAQNKTTMYLNGVPIGQVVERVMPSQVQLLFNNSGVKLKDWIIYRSSLSAAEALHLVDSPDILQASLEVYAPLAASSPSANYAQSMSALRLTRLATPESKSRVMDYVAVGVFSILLSAGCLGVKFLIPSRGKVNVGN